MSAGHDHLEHEHVNDESCVGNPAGDSEKSVTENDSKDPPHFMRHGEYQNCHNDAPRKIQPNRQQRGGNRGFFKVIRVENSFR